MGILAFGDDARAWARRFEVPPGELIIVDPSGASSAFLTAIETKKRGEPVVAAIAIDDPRASLAWMLGGMALNAYRSSEERSVAFDEIAEQRAQVEGRPQLQASPVDPRAMQTLRDFAQLADVILVRSWLEAQRLSRLLGISPAFHRSVARVPLELPPPDAEADRIVVWAPEAQAGQLALLTWGLVDLHVPVEIVCKSGTFYDPPFPVHRPENAAGAIRRATIVVDASLSDPHDAIELSRLGYRVVPAMTSGAHEYLDGVAPYVPWSHRSVRQSVVAALGRGAAIPRVQIEDASIETPDLRCDGPLASLVVRTYNRPRFLERALESIASQTYRNVEAVVVNDGGENVDAIVARFPFARLVVNPANLGVTKTANVGLRAVRGEYVGLLDDDDMLFPDHLSRLVDALERSGAGAANTDTITCYLELTPFSDYAVYGYRVALAHHIDPTEIYIRDPVAPMSVLVRRSALDAAGPFDETVEFAEDWELWIRLAERYDIVHVPHVTGIYSVRTDNTNTVVRQAAKFAGAFERIVELHPVSGRPLLDFARSEIIQNNKGLELTPRWGEPAIRFEPPRPLP